MLKDMIVKKTLLVALIITFGIGWIFVILLFINWFLLVGWLLGCLVTIFAFTISVLLINLSLKKIKTKSLGFWVGWARTFLHLFIHAVFFILVLLINTSINNTAFQIKELNDLINPVNLFTYLAGLSVITISMIIVNFLWKRRS